MTTHFKGEARPVLDGKWLRRLGILIVALFLLKLAINLWPSPEEKEAPVQAQVPAQVQPHQIPAFASARILQTNQALVRQTPLPSGNTAQEHTIIHKRTEDAVELSVDGTNHYIWYHPTGLRKVLQPGETLEVVASCVNPTDFVDYNSWGIGTMVWGDPRQWELLAQQEVRLPLIITMASGERRLDRFGALLVVLVDQDGELLPGSEGETYGGFGLGQTEVRLSYRNQSQQPIPMEVVLHRNLFLRSPSVANPNRLENQYGYSGARGDQYWRLNIQINAKTAAPSVLAPFSPI